MNDIINGAMGLISGIATSNNNREANRDSMRLANNMNRDNALFNHMLQKKLWNDTNYKAQVEQMKKAGLNPALMMGSAGASGSTQAIGMGNVSPLDMKQPNYGIEGAMMGAQMELIKAQAEKTRVEAEKIGGVDTEKTKVETESLTQGIENQKAQKELTEVQTQLGQIQTMFDKETLDVRIEKETQEYLKAIGEVKAIGYENEVNGKTIKEKVKIIQNEAIGGVLRNLGIKQDIEESKTRIWKMLEDVRQNDEKITIEKFKADLQAQYPSITNVTGNIVDEAVRNLWRLFGMDYDIGSKHKKQE